MAGSSHEERGNTHHRESWKAEMFQLGSEEETFLGLKESVTCG